MNSDSERGYGIESYLCTRLIRREWAQAFCVGKVLTCE